MLVLFVIAVFWIFVLFLDNIFRSCMLPPYINLLNNGLTIKVGIIELRTSRWNRCLQKWGCWRPRFQQKWFNLGVITTGVLIPVAIYFLCMSLRNFIISLSKPTGAMVQQELQIIQPVLPGINIPLSDLPYYIVTLLLCSVLHEIGHALAATREDVKVQGFGFFLMLIFPGAFVDLPSDQMSFLTPWQQLRIFCAGVWHNVVIVLASVVLLGTTPLLSRPFYERGNGVAVFSVDSNSGVSGSSGLQNGDIINGVNFCLVKDTNSWKTCLEELSRARKSGFCVSQEFINKEKQESQPISFQETDKNRGCCPPESQTDLCFAFDLSSKRNYSCLSARKVVDHSSQGCKSSEECKHSEVCLWATLKENSTLLVPIQRRGRKNVLFLGPLHELFSAVLLSDYVSRHWLVSNKPIQIWETFLKYIIAFSGALAILNVIPCFYLDGKFILKGFVELTFNSFDINTRNTITSVVTTAGTLLLGALVICGVLTLIKT